MNHLKTAQEIITLVGGLENITHIEHGSPRLRLSLQNNQRVLTATPVSNDNDDFYQEFLKLRPGAMKVAWIIKAYIAEEYAITLLNDEVTYLTQHICRLLR